MRRGASGVCGTVAKRDLGRPGGTARGALWGDHEGRLDSQHTAKLGAAHHAASVVCPASDKRHLSATGGRTVTVTRYPLQRTGGQRCCIAWWLRQRLAVGLLPPLSGSVVAPSNAWRL